MLNYPAVRPMLLRMLVPLTATETVERARTLMQAGRGAALPELLRLIETLSLNACEVTVSDLCDLIEKDAVVLGKILTVANTLLHNPGIARLESLSQAIHQIGYNRIRTIAVSLMLVRTANGELNPPEQREAAARALCSGLIAQATAESLGTHDPEFAFACGTLRDFGRIMFAAISPPLCRAAALRVPAVGDAEAYRESFGLTPLALSRDLLSAAGLPATVLSSLRDCEPELLASVASTFENRLLGIADFGTRVAHLALDSSQPADEFQSRLATLCTRFDSLVPAARELVRPALQSADERIRTFALNLTVKLPSALKIDRLRWRIAQLTPPEVTPVEVVTVASDANNPDKPSLVPAPSLAAVTPVAPPDTASVQTEADWDLLMAHSATFEVPAAASDPVRPMIEVLADIAAATTAEECWWFERQRVLPGFFLSERHGPTQVLPATPAVIEASDRSVFGVCLTRREVVLIHDKTEANVLQYLPDWFRTIERSPAAFALIPLLDSTSVVGLLLIGWSDARRIPLSNAEIALARRQLQAAIARSQSLAA